MLQNILLDSFSIYITMNEKVRKYEKNNLNNYMDFLILKLKFTSDCKNQLMSIFVRNNIRESCVAFPISLQSDINKSMLM